MSIDATNNSQPRILIPAGNYVSRCYSMVHIGTVEETILGETKKLNKVRITWELPTELKVFKEENGAHADTNMGLILLTLEDQNFKEFYREYGFR